MHGKYVSIVGAHFGSHWAKRGADADRKSLGKFGPAFVSDLIVFGHIEASQVLVDLQEIDRKSMVSGGLTRLETHEKCCEGAGSLTMAGVGSLGVGILPRAYLQWP